MTEPDISAEAKDPPRFVGGKTRFETVSLDWPVAFDGRTYTAIAIHRMTAGEVASFIDGLSSAPDRDSATRMQFPMFRDPVTGERVPGEVMAALDDDDSERVHEVTLRFLPRRLRAAAETEPARSGGAD